MTDDPHEGQRPNYLRAWREYRGLTQVQLAAAVGTDGSVIALLESGNRNLSDRWLRRLAPPLRTTPGILLDFDPNDIDEVMLEHWRRQGLQRPDALTLRLDVRNESHLVKWPRPPRTRATLDFPHHDAGVDPGLDIPDLWSRIADEDKPAALAALKALIPRH